MQVVPSDCLCCVSARQNNPIDFAELTNRHCLFCIDARKMLGLLQFQNCFVSDVKKKLTEFGQQPKTLSARYCLAHPSEDELASNDGQIIAKFLPSNVTPFIQPIDHCVLEYLNMNLPQVHLKRFDLTNRG